MGTLLSVQHLRKTYFGRRSFFAPLAVKEAVADVSFDILQGETLGLVGESGSGKSTLGRLILRLEECDSGKILYNGQDLVVIAEREMRLLRREVQIIFQDPFSSLNPRKTVFQILEEPLKVFGLCASAKEREEKIIETLRCVGLRESVLQRYPHEFSGGQRQRIGIARAIILKPKFIVCDEPVSALDVSIQAQILNLLQDLQSQFGFTYLFISHDLRVVRHLSHRVLVMYQGKIMEEGSCDKVFEQPETDYTRKLLASVPKIL